MIKVGVSDDELLVRIGIKSCVVWKDYGMEIVGEAENGVQTMELIQTKHIDILVLDINMPGKNGLEVMQEIKEKKIPCKVVILTGFDDFDHVKEAMKLGAIDYLHKPRMNAEGIMKALLNVRDIILEERKSNQDSNKEGIHEQEAITKGLFLKDLIEGRSGEDTTACKQYLKEQTRLGATNYICIVFKINHYKKVRERYPTSDINRFNISIDNLLHEILANEEAEYIRYDDTMYAILCSVQHIVSQQRMSDQIHRMVQVISDTIKQFLNVELTIGVSEIVMNYKDIKSAFIQSCKALSEGFYCSDSSVFYYWQLERKENKEILSEIEVLVEKIKEFIQGEDYKKALDISKELVKTLKEYRIITPEKVRNIFHGLLFLLEESSYYLVEMQHITESETLEQLYQTFAKTLQTKIKDQLAKQQYKEYSYIVQQLIFYIDEHYNQDISLDLLSKKFNITPNYISRIFKKETGHPLFDYLNEVRIEKAKVLLEKPELKIYEIGEQVGFNSSVHFNIVFNKYTGMSPKQYRNKEL